MFTAEPLGIAWNVEPPMENHHWEMSTSIIVHPYVGIFCSHSFQRNFNGMRKGLYIMLSEKWSRIQKYVNYDPNYNVYSLKLGGSKYSKMLSGYLWVVRFLHNFLCFLIFLYWSKILVYTKNCLKHWEYSSKCFQ